MPGPKQIVFFTALFLCGLCKAQDSTRRLGTVNFQQNVFPSDAIKEVYDTLLKPSDIVKLEAAITGKFLDSVLQLKNFVQGELTGLLKKPLSLLHADLSISSRYDNSFFTTAPALSNRLELTSSWSVTGVPLQFKYLNTRWENLR